MGAIYEASCKCGYTNEFAVGGTRSSFAVDAAFPFYCRCCGLVRVNIAELGVKQSQQLNTVSSLPLQDTKAH